MSDQNSSKVSEDKENSPEDSDSTEVDTEGQSTTEATESSSDEPEQVEAEPSDPVDGTDEIEDAEIVSEADADIDEASGDVEATDLANVTTEAPAPASSHVNAPTGPSTFGLVFGGLLAGAIGFLVATFAVPEGWPNPPTDPNEAMQATLDDQSQQIEALVARINELQNVPATATTSIDVDLGPVEAGISELSARIDGVSEGLAAASARIEMLEDAPTPVTTMTPAPDVNFDAEMETFRAELEAAAAAARAEVAAAQARADEIEAEAQAAAEAAEAAAQLATQRAALAEVSAALESGSPFADALTALPEAPEALVSVAVEGVPTLEALRAAFPDAARGALQTVQTVPADATAAERMAAFLRKQTNARSLSPREGDDPDAIFSRAEAALSDGDLAAALSELSGLPEGATQSMSGWIAEAETRVAALDAAQALSNELN